MDYSVLNLIPEPVLIIDENYRVVFANDKAKEVYGEGSDACYGFTYAFDVPCREKEGYPCPVENIKKYGSARSGVIHVHRTKKGERYVYVLTSYEQRQGIYVEVHIDLFDMAQALRLSGQRTELLFSSGPVVFFLWKREKGWPVEFVSPNVVDLLGYSTEDFTSGLIRYAELIHPEDIERVREEVERYTEELKPSWTHADYRIRRRDGSYIWVLDHTVPILDERGQVVGYYGYVLNITEKHEKEELFHILAESNPFAVLLYDFMNNRILYANINAQKLFGYSIQELLSHPNPITLIHEKDRHKALESITKRKEGYEGPISYSMRVITKKGKLKWVKLSSITTHYLGRKVSVITLIDISREVKREKKLTWLATRDQLTGALNRHALLHDFEHLITQAKRYNNPFSIIIFDIDNFKAINDKYGHLVGDRVLKEIAHRVKKSLRKSDLFARWGGEEFLILLPMTSEPHAPAEKIRRAVEESSLCDHVKVTISLGATTYKGGTL
ncbi:MAG: diguanylate cyclase [Aquificaceae bacterium]|nr:diguanylate cyclase [Aquificaceae bacterium]